MTGVNNLGGIMNVKKSLLFLLIVPLLFFLYSCGGGSGSGYNPSGTGTGEVSKIELLPTRYIAQTNGCNNIYVRVLDGDGAYLSNVPVTFTNFSSIGQILNKCGSQQVTSATTDSNGLAKVALYSTSHGFSTIQAEVNIGAGQVRERKTVYFSDYALTLPTLSSPTLKLEVDGNGNNIFDEPDDSTLFQDASDNQVIARATVLDMSGNPVFSSTVTFGADVAFKTSPSGTCSDGSTTCEVIFPLGNTKKTDSKGQASVLVEVDPSFLRTLKTNLNITAVAANGAANMKTLLMDPVIVDKVSVFANPQKVDSAGTSIITAQVTTKTGLVPDGTTVNFTTNIGGIEPFSETTKGLATAVFKAPTLLEGSFNQTANIIAKVGGKQGSVDVTVKALPAPPVTPTAPTIVPGSVTVLSGSVSQTVKFTISGGTSPYITTSTDPANAFNDNGVGGGTAGDGTMNGQESGIWTGSQITVTIPANATAGSVTLNVFDSLGATTSATITISGAGPGPGPGVLKVEPTSISLTGISDASDKVTFIITGGTSPYSMFSDNTAVIPNADVATSAPFTFTIDPNPVATTTAVTLTVVDKVGAIAKAIATITPASSSITINPSTIAVHHPTTITFRIIGGLAKYKVYSSDTAVLTVSGGGGPYEPTSDTFDAVTVGAGNAIITVVDSDGKTATATVTVTAAAPPTPPAALSVSPPSATICENTLTCSAHTDVATFTISGGTPPYTVTSLTPAVIGDNPIPVLAGGIFYVNAKNDSISAPAPGGDVPVILLINDNGTGGTSVIVTVINE